MCDVVIRHITCLDMSEVGERKNLSLAALGALVTLLSGGVITPGYRSFKGRGMRERDIRGVLKELEQADLRFRFTLGDHDHSVGVVVVSDTPLTVDEASDLALEQLTPIFSTPTTAVLECNSHVRQIAAPS